MIFLKDLKHKLVKTYVKLTNRWRHHSSESSIIFSQGAFWNMVGILEMRRNITSPGRTCSTKFLSWLNCSLFYIPQHSVLPLLPYQQYHFYTEILDLHIALSPTQLQAPPGQGECCIDFFGPMPVAWHISSFQVSWMNEKCTHCKLAWIFH